MGLLVGLLMIAFVNYYAVLDVPAAHYSSCSTGQEGNPMLTWRRQIQRACCRPSYVTLSAQYQAGHILNPVLLWLHDPIMHGAESWIVQLTHSTTLLLLLLLLVVVSLLLLHRR